MKNELKSLTNSSLIKFQGWIDLNLSSITWEGRNLDEFNEFWSELFRSGTTIEDQFSKFRKIRKLISQGPVNAWFTWLEEKFLIYLFVFENYDIVNLARLSSYKPSTISLILRDFFVDRIPHLEDKISDLFQLSNSISPALTITYIDFKNRYSFVEEIRGSLSEEVMTSLEVTLYDDWKKVFNETCVNQKEEALNSALKEKSLVKRNFKFVKELVLLFILGGLFIFLVKVGNKAYENYLVEKISLFSPSFFWLDKNISFKPNALNSKDLEISQNQIDELEKLESKKVFVDSSTPTRFEVESDVALTSVETLPKDFAVAGFEQSDYEEKRKGGYRNNRYGRRKAYRVMMSSVKPERIKALVIKMLSKFKVKQVDNVKPGTEIPGGIYFNLYVPRKELKSFLKTVSSFEDESTILESKTVFGGPRGMDKVFVWIKSI